ncbi:MAG: hypothetical protein KDA61_19480, partial [Planctomycetales bacterium]|nr:hypothetical protein [Planctomycetales bacterium]
MTYRDLSPPTQAKKMAAIPPDNPAGDYLPADAYSDDLRVSLTEQIGAAPALLRAVVAGLSN